MNQQSILSKLTDDEIMEREIVSDQIDQILSFNNLYHTHRTFLEAMKRQAGDNLGRQTEYVEFLYQKYVNGVHGNWVKTHKRRKRRNR